MSHGFQSKRELPDSAKGSEVATKIPDGPFPAVAAPGQRQPESELIMEALVREYLNSEPPSD